MESMIKEFKKMAVIEKFEFFYGTNSNFSLTVIFLRFLINYYLTNNDAFQLKQLF